jgi:Predicted membrane protein (DUF2306)
MLTRVRLAVELTIDFVDDGKAIGVTPSRRNAMIQASEGDVAWRRLWGVASQARGCCGARVRSPASSLHWFPLAIVGIGPVPPEIVANAFATPWLLIHIAGAATALLVGSFQFVGRLRQRWPSVHRWTGRVYAASCLVGGVTGLLLALGTTMGPVATAGFGILSILWVLITGHAWQLAGQRRFLEHRRWMIRSWLLTFAAVNLRLYVFIATHALNVDFDDSYPVISFLCWVPNLIAAEVYLMAAEAAKRSRASTSVP